MAYLRWSNSDWYVFRESSPSKQKEDQSVAIAFDTYQQWRYTYGELKRNFQQIIIQIEKELRVEGREGGADLDQEEVLAIDKAMDELVPALEKFLLEVESDSNKNEVQNES